MGSAEMDSLFVPFGEITVLTATCNIAGDVTAR